MNHATSRKENQLHNTLLNPLYLKVSRSWKKNCRAVASPKKQTDEYVFLSWWLKNTWKLNFDFKFQVFPSRQDRKTNSFVCFLREAFGSTILFWDLLTFTKTGLQKIKSKTKSVVFPAINQAAINWLYVGLKIPLICFLGQKLYVLLWMGIQKLWNKQEYKI